MDGFNPWVKYHLCQLWWFDKIKAIHGPTFKPNYFASYNINWFNLMFIFGDKNLWHKCLYCGENKRKKKLNKDQL